MNNKNFISMESSCFFEVQETPTELKINKRNYNEYKDIAKKLTINYIKRNKNLHFNNLVTPNYTHIEIREISRLKETLAKTDSSSEIVEEVYDNSATEAAEAIAEQYGVSQEDDN